MAIKKKSQSHGERQGDREDSPDVQDDGATSGITVQTSNIGNASMNSETPLIKMASSASGTELSLGEVSQNTQLQVPAVAYYPGGYAGQSPPGSPAGMDDKPVATTRTGKYGSRKLANTKKRWQFRAPISTVTSSILASRPKRKRMDTDDAFTANSQASDSVLSKDAVAQVISAQNSGSDLDRELGHNDGKGNEGVLRRVYDTWALTSLGVANIGPVAGAFFGVHTAKEYGGYGMLSIGWPLSGLCMCIFSAVLAEISSSYPVAGAMYTWTFRLCRLSPTLRPLARFLSWLCGSFLLCGHILAQMLLEWQMATTFQGLIVIYAEGYNPSTWKTIAFAWAGLLISAAIATSSLGRSPNLWKAFSIFLISTVIIIVTALFASNHEHNTTAFIFTSYANHSGFSAKGYVYLLGWVLTSIATGQDIAAHLAEESVYPTKTVPRAIFWCTFLSYLAGYIVMLSIMAVSREDFLGKQTTRDYGAPAQLMTEVLPRPMAFCIILLLVVLMQFQDIAQLLASSRFIWALARDSAIPFSPWLGRLSTARIPVRATWAVCGIAGPALLLVAASRKIVTSLVLQGCGSSLVLAYLIPVICYLTCGRGALDSDGRNEWTLRGWSKPLALFGSTYVLLIITLMLCPNTAPVTASSFSYAGPIILFVTLMATLSWVLYGNSHYAGPIKSITVYTIGREVELPTASYSQSTNRPTPNGEPTPNFAPNDNEAEIGKTANLYSASLATFDVHPTTTRGTEMTDYTEGDYSDDGYTTDGSRSERGSRVQ